MKQKKKKAQKPKKSRPKPMKERHAGHSGAQDKTCWYCAQEKMKKRR